MSIFSFGFNNDKKKTAGLSDIKKDDNVYIVSDQAQKSVLGGVNNSNNINNNKNKTTERFPFAVSPIIPQ